MNRFEIQGGAGRTRKSVLQITEDWQIALSCDPVYVVKLNQPFVLFFITLQSFQVKLILLIRQTKKIKVDKKKKPTGTLDLGFLRKHLFLFQPCQGQ